MRILLLATLIFTSHLSMAGGINETGGARSLAMGGASVALVDGWSTNNNIAGLALLQQHHFSATFESRFLLAETSVRSLSGAFMLGGGTVGVLGHNYGFAGYSTNRFGLSYARQLSDYIALGVQVNYVQVRMGDIYGQRATVVGEIGLMVMPNDKMKLGAHLYNPTRSRLADFDDERLPSALRVGAHYSFSETVGGVLEVEKDIDLPLNVKSGIEYRPVQPLFIRVGFATAQRQLAFGLGFNWKGLQADVAASWKQYLGYSSALTLAYRFGNRKE